MKPEIQEVRDEIERLENKLRILMHECTQTNANIHHRKTSGSYYDDPEEYIYVECHDCGIEYTYDTDDKMFYTLKNRL